ncbi:SRPBCC domain-containing protein [Streptomyces sp. NPDC003042]
MSPVSHGTSEPGGEGRRLIRFELHVPHAYEDVWPVLTTADGLRGWLAEAEVLERRLGGAVTLRRPTAGTAVSGHITAWDVERVVEYTVSEEGRIRFHLEAVGTDSTVIRFLNERSLNERSLNERSLNDGGGRESELLDCLADWHERFERLEAALAGYPADWDAWTDARRADLRASYAALSGA